MNKNVLRSLQAVVAAAAVGLGSLAAAQPAQPGQAPAKHAYKKGQRHDQRDVAEGSSSAREAAAARQADRRGQLSGGSSEELTRNALARCAVFKVEEDRRACASRVTQGQDSGSVEGGGILREYTYSVPAN